MATALKWNMIAWIVDDAGDALVTDATARAKYIKEAAKVAGVKEPRIRMLLTRYYYYGAHPNALMSLDGFKGGPGVSRLGITTNKVGAPNANVLLNPNTKFKGRGMSKYYLRIWKQVLWEQYALGNKSVSEAYEVLLLRLVAKNRSDSGEIVSYPISPEKLPERSLFLRHGREIISEFEMKREKLGDLDWKNRFAGQRGHAEDLTHGVIDIYDFDGMEFNIELLYGQPENKLKHVGKPNVLLAVDRASRAVVGWYAWLGKENGFAYKHCLFNAFTPKETRLMRYGVPELGGFVYGVCEQAFFDRGPGISLKVTQAVTERIRVDGLLTRPREAKGKSVVENVNGIFEGRLSELQGGYKRTKSIRDQDKHRAAEALAKIEYDVFMRLLLCAISDYNLYTNVSHLLTGDMLRGGIRPNPKAIFLWNRNQDRGDATYEWPPSLLYKNLLERVEVTVTNGVVTVGKAKYRSDLLTRHYEQWNSGPHDKTVSPPVTIYKFAETDEILAWEQPDGSISLLEMTERGKRQYQDSPQWLHSYINKMTVALAREQRVDKAKNGFLPAAKEKAIRDADGYPSPRIVKGEKRLNRAKANSEIVAEQFASKLEILGQIAITPPAAPLPAKERQLIGYRKPSVQIHADDDGW
ncbi:hypothetical protein [Noviherbaspirillum aridicola]|nr:hypothetical protein [Noviherbaspirillum aridicola]